jgi:hypothetical protein
MIQQSREISSGAGEEIIDTQHMVTLLDQSRAQMRTDETGTACDQHSLLDRIAGLPLFISHRSNTRCSIIGQAGLS